MEIAIIGGGPAGYSAALYCARFGRKVTVFEAEAIGGQMRMAAKIDNCFGFPQAVSGVELAQRMCEQAERAGTKSVFERVTKVERYNDVFQIKTVTETHNASVIIAATGADARQLGLPNERELIGRGVSYCAACDATFFRGKTVAVIGGATSAVTQALHLSQLCKSVFLLCRKPSLRAPEAELSRLSSAENIQILFNTVVIELLFDSRIRGIRYRTQNTEGTIVLNGVFVAIGREPKSELFQQLLPTDTEGFLLSNEQTATEIPGLFVAGDVRHKSVRQIATAVADGVCAAFAAESYLYSSGQLRNAE